MSYGWKDAKLGRKMVFDNLVPGEATAEILTHLIEQVSFGVSLTGLNGQASFQLEGRIGENWFKLPQASDSFPGEPNKQYNSILSYGQCATLDGIRCRFVTALDAGQANPGDPLPVAVVQARAATSLI